MFNYNVQSVMNFYSRSTFLGGLLAFAGFLFDMSCFFSTLISIFQTLLTMDKRYIIPHLIKVAHNVHNVLGLPE